MGWVCIYESAHACTVCPLALAPVSSRAKEWGKWRQRWMEQQSTGSTSWEYISLLLALCVRRSRHEPRCVFQVPSCLFLRKTADTQRKNGFCSGKDLSLMDMLACTKHLYLYKSPNATPFCLLAFCLHRHVSMWRNADLSCDMAKARKTELCHVVPKPV